jgi:transglutaminase-like putative cysteine protease
VSARLPLADVAAAANLSPAALIRGAVGPEQQQTTQQRWPWRAMEAAITLGILLLVIISVSDSIAAANWVDGMPDVRVTALLALIAAAALAARRLHWIGAYLIGLALGVIVVCWQMLGMEHFSGQAWFWERFIDLRFRLEDWFTQAFNDGITTDNVPFVFFVVVAIWLATFPATLLVLRRRNPWPLLILLGTLLAVNVSYLGGRQWDLHFAFFVIGAALLLMRTSLLARMRRWRSRGTPFPDFISVSFLGVTLLAVVALLVVSRALPRPDRAEPLNALWSGITEPFDELSLDMERLFGGVDSQRGAPIHSFSSNFILQGDINPGQGIVVRVDAPEVGLLRGASYDRYTTRGWQQSSVVTTKPVAQGALGGEDDSAYTARRDVVARLSVEQSARVLFTFGLPREISRDVTVDQTAPGAVRLDIDGAAMAAPRELEGVAQEIADREEAGESFSAEVIPEGWVPVGSEVGDDGELLALELENRPLEPDVLRVHPAEPVRAGFTYEVRGSVSSASVDQLRGAGREYPFWVRQRYLQLPSDLDDRSLGRLESLAASVVGGSASRYDAAAAIEGYLCCTPLRDDAGEALLTSDGAPRLLYPFTRDVALPPPRADAVTWWLLDYRDADGLPVGGYYDYHASAMAVLLRTLGIPARVSTGYVLTDDNFDPRTGTFIVRGQHAYSWVEVFFPEYGWVDFDPTPPVVTEGFAAIGGQRIAEQRLRPFASDLLGDSGPLVDPLLDPFGEFLSLEELSAQLDQEGFTRDTSFNPWTWWVLLPAALVLALLLASGGWAAAWQFSLRGQTPVERLWTSTQRLSRWGGLRVDPADTPREYAAALGDAVRAPEASRRLADTYTRERFSAGALPESHYAQALGAWRALRGRLLRRVFRLPVPSAADASAPPAAPEE